MKVIRNNQGVTLVEVIVVIAIIAILAALILPQLQRARRAVKQWTTGVYTVRPTQVQWAPATGTFVFSVTRGVGVNANGRPVGPGVILPGDTWDFELIGSGGDAGVIKSLNGAPVDLQTGTATSDRAGLITIVVQVDDDGPYVLVAQRPGATVVEERTLFIGVE